VNASSIYTTIACVVVGSSLWCPLYARHPKMIRVDRSYNGREVTLAVGEVVEISLAENPTTGFRWDLEVKPEPACTLVNSTFEPATGPPGKGGTHRWQFRAARSGTGEILLEYRRPWERNTPPGQTFKLSLRVRKESSTRDSTARSE
jgi:inhibitor of cysteine peptidase